MKPFYPPTSLYPLWSFIRHVNILWTTLSSIWNSCPWIRILNFAISSCCVSTFRFSLCSNFGFYFLFLYGQRTHNDSITPSFCCEGQLDTRNILHTSEWKLNYAPFQDADELNALQFIFAVRLIYATKYISCGDVPPCRRFQSISGFQIISRLCVSIVPNSPRDGEEASLLSFAAQPASAWRDLALYSSRGGHVARADTQIHIQFERDEGEGVWKKIYDECRDEIKQTWTKLHKA